MGDKIDKELAEKVMGWTVAWEPNSPWMEFSDGEGTFIGWSPSTKMADAWSVIDHHRKHGHRVTLQLDGPIWRVWINGGLPSEHESAPMAICMAALAATAPPGGPDGAGTTNNDTKETTC